MPKKTHKKLAKQVKRMRSFVTQVYRDSPKSLFNYKQLAAKIDLESAEEKQVLVAVLESMVKDGSLEEVARGKFIWKGPPTSTLKASISIFNASARFTV